MAQGGSGSLEEHAVDHRTDAASGLKMVVFEATRRGTAWDAPSVGVFRRFSSLSFGCTEYNKRPRVGDLGSRHPAGLSPTAHFRNRSRYHTTTVCANKHLSFLARASFYFALSASLVESRHPWRYDR